MKDMRAEDMPYPIEIAKAIANLNKVCNENGCLFAFVAIGTTIDGARGITSLLSSEIVNPENSDFLETMGTAMIGTLQHLKLVYVPKTKPQDRRN